MYQSCCTLAFICFSLICTAVEAAAAQQASLAACMVARTRPYIQFNRAANGYVDLRLKCVHDIRWLTGLVALLGNKIDGFSYVISRY